MAHKYKRKNSPFWWIKYRDITRNKIIREATGFRIGVGIETRKADEMVATKTLAERQAPANLLGEWDLWVEDFIKDKQHGQTQARYLTMWRSIRKWLHEYKIICPRNLTYALADTYVKWRGIPDQRNGKYKACKNTAILEFKIFRWIMREAVKRDYCTGNIAREVVLKREPRKEFPDYTDAQLKLIHAAILTEPEPDRTRFLNSFAISLFQGVRLSETYLNPTTAVNLDAEIPTIRFFQKGGKDRTKPLHPQLRPLFQRLQKDKATETYEIGKFSDGRLRWGNKWTKFWLRHKFKETIPNCCFHSLRITVENVLREAGIEQRVREFFLSHEHGSDDVNARYDRVKIREMLACHAPLNRSWLEV